MRSLSPSLLAEFAALLRAPDPTDLITATGAHRGHVRTYDGDPRRRLALLLHLILARVPVLARPSAIDRSVTS